MGVFINTIRYKVKLVKCLVEYKFYRKSYAFFIINIFFKFICALHFKIILIHSLLR